MRFAAAEGKTRRVFWVFMVIIAIIFAITVWLLIRTTWGAKTLSYSVTSEAVTITYGPDDVHIDTASITDIYIIEKPTKGVRRMGTSMPGLKEGRWSFAETGAIRLYASTTDQLVVIETSEQKWGVSPHDPELFIDAVFTHQTDDFSPRQAADSSALIGVGLLLAFAIVVMFAITYYMIRITRTAHYELTDDNLFIHGGLSPVSIPLHKITSAEHMEPSGLPIRLFGIGMPGLHWGTFSWNAVGPRLKLYATRLRPLVVLRAKGRTWGITPQEPDTFLSELRKRLPTNNKN